MYDALTGRYTFSCPRREQAQVALSAFRRLERLPGAAHPAVYGVLFDCGCGDEHTGLVAHDDLDWAPLGAAVGDVPQPDDVAARRRRRRAHRRVGAPSRRGRVAVELLLLPGRTAASRLPVLVRRGRSRGTQSSGSPFAARPASPSRSISSRRRTSICRSGTTRASASSTTSSPTTSAPTVERFRAELYSSRFDERRLNL